MSEIIARVVNPFQENEHNGHVYKAGDVYPVNGFIANEERVYFLTGMHPKYKKIYLADVTIQADINTQNNEGDYPKHAGGGWYTLSDGQRVQGKDEAAEAQNKLNSGE